MVFRDSVSPVRTRMLLTHLSVEFMPLHTFVRLLRTSKAIRKTLLRAFRERKSRMVETARTLGPILLNELCAGYRSFFSPDMKVMQETNGEYHCVNIQYKPDARDTLVCDLSPSGTRVELTFWMEPHIASPGDMLPTHTRVLLVVESAQSGYYSFYRKRGRYTQGVVACLRALRVVP